MNEPRPTAVHRTAAAILAVLAGCHPVGGREPHPRVAATMPGPARAAPARGRGELNAGCVRCHALQAEEWNASQHRAAHDFEFRRAAAQEREHFCRSCHAPEADPSGAPSRDAAHAGVACVTCHLPHGTAGDDGVLAGTSPTGSMPAPHALTRTAAFTGTDACAGCHEFAFPRRPELAMQATLTEHAQSAFADTPCAECHMPWIGEGPTRHRNHAFAASRDPQMLRSAVTVDASRSPGGNVQLTLSPGRIGHAFPTGDLFRRLWVDAEVVDAQGDPVAYDGRALARHFARPGDPMVSDDRPGAPALADRGGVVDVTFELGADADAHSIHWRVVHQRVELPLDGDDANVFGETIVNEGRLPATGAFP